MSSYVEFNQVLWLDTIVRLKNSRNGNPRYLLAFHNGLVGKTKTDAGFAYSIHSGMTVVKVTFHFTPKGKCIITDMQEG